MVPARWVALGTASLLSVGCAHGDKSWSLGPSLPIERSEVAVAVTDSKLYVIGGYTHDDAHAALNEEYDTITRTWHERAPMPRGLNHVGAVGYAGKIYTFGGFRERRGRNPVRDAYVFDPSTDRWIAIAPMPTALGSVSVAVIDRKIHVVGGHDTGSVTTHRIYDPLRNAWSSAAPLPHARDHMLLVAVREKLYAIGGRFNDVSHNTSFNDVYDPKTDRWTERAALPTPRSGCAGALFHGRIDVIAGERAGGIFTENESYDPLTNTWASLAPLPDGRHGTGAAVVGNALYIPAGAPLAGGGSSTLYIFKQP